MTEHTELSARDFLYGKTNKGQSSVDGMRGAFAVKLANMMTDPTAPEGLGIYSGYRSPEHQAEIIRAKAGQYGLDGDAWWSDVEAIGPIGLASEKWRGIFRSSGQSLKLCGA